MEPRGSLLHSPATCPYPESDQSKPCPPSHFLKIHFNITLPSKTRSYKWPPSFRTARQNSVRTSPVPHTWRMPHPTHSSWFGHPNNIWWEIQIVKLSCYIFPIRLNSSDCVSPQCEGPNFTPIENNRQNYIAVYHNLYFGLQTDENQQLKVGVALYQPLQSILSSYLLSKHVKVKYAEPHN
jgi:hypothetical protein